MLVPVARTVACSSALVSAGVPADIERCAPWITIDEVRAVRVVLRMPAPVVDAAAEYDSHALTPER
jgi:hypothetical protein